MAVTVTTNSLNGALAEVAGSRRVACVRVQFDATYPAGGEVVTAAALGLSYIEALIVSGSSTGQVCFPDRQADGTYKLKLFEEAGGTEEATADQSAVEVEVVAFGQ